MSKVGKSKRKSSTSESSSYLPYWWESN